MAIEARCDSCGAMYRVREESAGKMARCKKCGATFRVPDLEPPPIEEEQANLEPPPLEDDTYATSDYEPAGGAGRSGGGGGDIDVRDEEYERGTEYRDTGPLL